MRTSEEVQRDMRRPRRTDRDNYAATNRLTVELLHDIRELLQELVTNGNPPKGGTPNG